jgi:hypothetical protein
MLERSIEAANLLGRWTRVSQLHAEGCSCCGGGFGNVSMRTVERSLLAYLRETHPEVAGREDLAQVLTECIRRKCELSASLLEDLGRAIDHLERTQAGLDLFQRSV